ncbi:IclR family transcriptional regulator [Flintibacter muris]|uniref:IclR family transcriptional regulator n=1 Tax=Flintibacter muris TaxID=2941327 RepID=UPI00203F1F85|nr:IclR family transcriptional regulator [Flintibacter muris]
MQEKQNGDFPKKDSVRAVDRMLDILQVFSFEQNELNLAQICVQAGLPKTTTYRILTTLEKRNVVVQDPHTGKYRLGYEVIKMGSIARTGNSLQRAAHEDMEKISRETQQTCNLYVRDGFERRCVDQVEGTQYVKRFSYLGARHPLYCGAGKLLLAYADPDVQKQYFAITKFEKYTDQTVTDPEQLKEELRQILRDGYSVTKGERDPMTAMVSVPLYDYTQKVVASITVSGPVYLFTDENIKLYCSKLLQASENISRKLGYSPPKTGE